MVLCEKKKKIRAASIRLAAGFWWFLTLIMVSSYTANLATFLIAEKREPVFKDVEHFKSCGLPNEPACNPDFGMKREGATYEFFKVNIYLCVFPCDFFPLNFYFDFFSRSGLFCRNRNIQHLNTCFKLWRTIHFVMLQIIKRD